MSARAIYCHKCRAYLGVIRDALLRQGIVHMCAGCAKPAKKGSIEDLFRGMGINV